MGVSREEVERIARLARLRLSPAEAERLALELSRVLEHVEMLAHLDVTRLTGVGDMTEWSVPLEPRGEPDPLTRPFEASAPDWRDGFFAVPRLPALDTEDGDQGGVDPEL